METPTKAAEAPKSMYHSLSSVADVKNGMMVLSQDAVAHIQETVSEEDPYVLIHWVDDGVMDALNAFHAGLIPNLPVPPPFVNPNSPE